MYKRPASLKPQFRLDLLEICAYPKSVMAFVTLRVYNSITTFQCDEVCCFYSTEALSYEWALRGLSSVRIAHRKNQNSPKSGPQPVKGRSLTWCLCMLVIYFHCSKLC